MYSIDKYFDVDNYQAVEDGEYKLLSQVHKDLINSIDNDNDIQSQKLLKF